MLLIEICTCATKRCSQVKVKMIRVLKNTIIHTLFALTLVFYRKVIFHKIS